MTQTSRLPSRAHVADDTPGGSALAGALGRAKSALLQRQKPEGYWVGELQGDSILESEYILLQFILEHDSDAELPLIGNYLRGLQQPSGGWSQYPGGDDDLSATVKGYFALKLLGDSPKARHMRLAREVCLRLGGAQQCNSYTNFFLAALGQISYDVCPAIPPEIVFLPRWAYFNLYAVSAWSRTMILPLAIVSALKPVRRLAARQGISELFASSSDGRVPSERFNGLPRDWRQVFLLLNRYLKIYDAFSFEPLRRKAIGQAEQWLLSHMDDSEGLGAIFPPMAYILIVLRALGYADEHPRVRQAQEHLRALFIREGETIRIQPCLSPVWDTGIALHALADAGLEAGSDAASRGTGWLLSKECRTGSDWMKNCPDVAPSGWFFEFANPHYPDVDDTAMVLMALKRLGGEGAEGAIERGRNWLLALQNSDGGWAAFDRTRNRRLLEEVPFADHNAMQDPSCPDITGRVLEALGRLGVRPGHAAACKAVGYLQKTQHKDGCWFGRWGVNYIYGTWQVLTGLKALGHPMNQPIVQAAAHWLRGCQKGDGSWGESCRSYLDPSLKGQGPATPSQTAWALMGLLAVAGPHDPAVQRGVKWLIEHQEADGTWAEPFFTGTGFPKVFYLKYHLYPLYFPLMALARYGKAVNPGGESGG